MALELGGSDDVARAYVNLSDAMRLCSLTRESVDVVRAGIVDIDRLGATGSYGATIRENGATIQFEIGDWDAADHWARESRRMVRPGRNAWLYHLAYTVGIGVARDHPDVAGRLDRFADLLEGQPVEGQYHGAYALAAAEHALWKRRPGEAWDIVEASVALLSDHWFPYYLSQIHAIGARAAADLAELARAERTPPDVVETQLARIDRHVDRIRRLIAAHTPEPAGMHPSPRDASCGRGRAEPGRRLGRSRRVGERHGRLALRGSALSRRIRSIPARRGAAVVGRPGGSPRAADPGGRVGEGPGRAAAAHRDHVPRPPVPHRPRGSRTECAPAPRSRRCRSSATRIASA